MTVHLNWFQCKRADQIIMAKIRCGTLADRLTAWGVPASDVMDLEAITSAARERRYSFI
jgi:hypothetical protein